MPAEHIRVMQNQNFPVWLTHASPLWCFPRQMISLRMKYVKFMTQVFHSFNKFSVPQAASLHTRWSPTYSDIYQMYWYNWFSWWGAHGRSKHVENWNRHTRKRIVRKVVYLQELYWDAQSAKNKHSVVSCQQKSPRFQIFATFWMLYVFFWVIPQCLNFICWRFGTHCSIFIGG